MPFNSFQAALAHHQAGRLPQAEAICRQLLQVEPNHSEALHLLGLIAHQAGKSKIAAELIGKAVGISPSSQMYCNLGVILYEQGRFKEAETSYRRALELKPDFASVHNNLGNALRNLNRPAEAEASFRQALKFKPDYANAHYNMGLVLNDMGRFLEAEASYRQALAIKPDYAGVHFDLGIVLQNLGQFADAVASYRCALAMKPDYAEAHFNLGIALQNLGQLADAAASYRCALSIKPDCAEAYCNLGNTLSELGRPDEAVASYRQALAMKPDYAEAHYNLGIVLQKLGQLADAVASYRSAVAIKPGNAEAHSNLGNALCELGRLDEAETSYCQALAIKPDYAEAHLNLGNALKELGRLGEAEASYRQALTIKPDLAEAYGNMLYLHAFTRNISPELECSLAANWEVIALNERERTAARQRALSFDNLLECPSGSGKKMRVGVVSAEIGQHAVAEFLEPFLEQIDRSRFHVTLFPTIIKHSSRADRLRKLADTFRPLAGISDGQAADLIRSERIDILIDTTAHMSGSRLGIFAHRAAPVQCHYIGYHGTTGLTEMDWFIADETLLPAACDAHFREGIWRLPRLWVSYRGDYSLPLSNWAPSSDGSVWLGSFNNLTKVREETLSLWAKVMHAIPESRLFLKDRQSASYSTCERIKMALSRYGINNERVEFSDHVPDWSSHMALYDRLDIALDTIPLNSGTTAFDALWMGVPLVALEGSWMGGRMSGAILKALGKPEWVAQNEDEYVAITAALARDVEGRKSLRAAQRELMASSPLCDAKGLTRAIEDAFKQMFDRWMEKRECAHKECNEKNRS